MRNVNPSSLNEVEMIWNDLDLPKITTWTAPKQSNLVGG